ncbi:MAG: BON domain-containing protein [Patescibacteria group bacterium]|nr:BON domain-containing protein [Patescibacteria group bacterium]
MNGGWMNPWAMGPGMPPYGGAPAYGPFGAPTYVMPGGAIDDAEIASYVRDNIDLDPFIPTRDKNNIDVEVEGGVAKLSGTVNSRRSQFLAYADAFWSIGVTEVETNLQVAEQPSKPTQKSTK